MSTAIRQYTASDGQEVTLTPETVRAYIMTGNASASDRDVARFLVMCQARKLNPLAGDAYMTTFRNKDGSSSTSVIVSKDYYIRTARQMPTHTGFTAGVITMSQDGAITYRQGSFCGNDVLVGGWADVYDSRWSVPSHAEVAMSEYDQGRSMWRSKPATMIRKVALVQALREAYPEAFAGLYDASEMPEHERSAQVMASEATEPRQTDDSDATGIVEPTYEERPSQGVLESRRARLAELAGRLADATGQDVTECKRAMMALGDFRTMNDEEFEAYTTDIERGIIEAVTNVEITEESND